MSEYSDTISYLFSQVAMFQNVGAEAYKPGLHTTLSLAEAFGNPHKAFPAIHIAGTNGKGSTAHTIAAVLQAAGYRTGLFTSPHLIDFRERIRVDGEMISEEGVVDFMRRYRSMGLKLAPSFFELTTIMAFDWFAMMGVDVAVIETGLGGRLDSTNIITPELSIITNISYDHMALLGDSLPQIAYEKAGIIKPGIPVVIGEADDPEVKEVFADKAASEGSPIVFADESAAFASATPDKGFIHYASTPFGDIYGALCGECQKKNTATILRSLEALCKKGFAISDSHVRRGFKEVNTLTGLAGRWMIVGEKPRIVCDTGHNTGGWKYLSETLSDIHGLKMVIGFVNDKDITGILSMMPRHATYYFTSASVRRALDADTLALLGREAGLKGEAYTSVEEAYKCALADSAQTDTIFIGGSTFVVADFLLNFFPSYTLPK